jgi:hypothetical protein
MRVDRFTVLFFAVLLSALLAVVLGSPPVAVVSAAAPAEPCLVEAAAESPMIGADFLAVVDATVRPGRSFADTGASQSLVYPALSRVQGSSLGAHSDRSPPA